MSATNNPSTAAKEIEYKYLIKRPDIDTLTSMDGCRQITIIQFYLTSSPGEERRVRQLEESGNRTFVKTTKHKTGERATRLEEEEVISFAEYTKLIRQEADPDCQPVIKTRYRIPQPNGLALEIDIYPSNEKYAILEIEVPNNETKVDIPEPIVVVRDVTSDSRFKNRQIAKNGGKLPED